MQEYVIYKIFQSKFEKKLIISEVKTFLNSPYLYDKVIDIIYKNI